MKRKREVNGFTYRSLVQVTAVKQRPPIPAKVRIGSLLAYLCPELRGALPGSFLIAGKRGCNRGGATPCNTPVLLALLLALGCGDGATNPPGPPPAKASQAPSTSSIPTPSGVPLANPSASAAGGQGDGKGGGQRGMKGGDAPVHLDGKPLGIVRLLELPAKLEPSPHKLEDGREVRRYPMGPYLQSLGIDLGKVKELHLTGGRNRTSIIAGAELIKHSKTLTFSFTRGDEGGRPRVHWPGSGIDINTSIDVISSISVYVAIKPPRYEREKRSFFYEDGTRAEGVPFTKPEESLRGTRVYRDGALAGSVKRKRLPDAVLASSYTAAKPRYSLDAYLASIGVDPARISTLVLIKGDDIVARLSAADWKKLREKAEFSLTPGSEGRMLVHLPKDAGETEIPASAVLAYEKAPPPKRVTQGIIKEIAPGSPEAPPEPD